MSALPLLAACGAPSGAPEAQPAQPVRFEGKTLTHWGSYDAPGREAWLKHYDRFVQEKAPGLKVEIQNVTNAEYLPKLTAAIVGGAPPDTCRRHTFRPLLRQRAAQRPGPPACSGRVRARR